MKILSIELNNFQGIKHLKYDFDGKSVSIYGDNETGKTTTFNAITWLFFDKPSTGAKNFTPKTRTEEGEEHNLDHRVTIKVQKDDGLIVVLGKVFHEIWEKKRGSNEQEFSGHSTDYYIDDVPVKKKEFSSLTDSFCGDEEKTKVLTMPNYFPETMPWEQRRATLVGIFGDVTYEDILSKNNSLREDRNLLLKPGTTAQYYTVEEFGEKAKVQKAIVNRDLKDIESRIDEAKKAQPDLTGKNKTETALRMAAVKAAIEELKKEKAQIASADGSLQAIRQNTESLRTEIAQKQREYIEDHTRNNEESQKIVASALATLRNEEEALQISKQGLNDLARKIAIHREDREKLLVEYRTIESICWDDNKEICATCRQTLPAGDIKKAKETFNLNKSKNLEAINERGKECSHQVISKTEEEIIEKKKRIVQIEKNISEYKENLRIEKEKLKPGIPFADTEPYRDLSDKLFSLENDKDKANAIVEEKCKKINEQITALEEEKKKLEAEFAYFRLYEQQKKRIEELEDLEKKLGETYSIIEKGLYYCEQFTRTKMEMLSSKINDIFDTVKFRLFKKQINGGISEDCEVMVRSTDGTMVPYPFANNAARINAGLEIIDVLSKIWGVSFPVVVDNAESVTALKDIGSQVIRLVVSEADKKLRLEV